jgi:hypothetical protein
VALMKLGDLAVSAMWLDGRETPAQHRAHEQVCEAAMRMAEKTHKVMLGPISYVEKRPGELQVPPVPGNIAGPNVRLLVAEAKVLAKQPEILPPRSFLLDLDLKDHMRLRTITKRAHRRASPTEPLLTDAEADRIIEQFGPDAAIEALKQAVNARTLH